MLAPVMTLLVFLSEISNETMPKVPLHMPLMYDLIVFSFVRLLDEVSLVRKRDLFPQCNAIQCNSRSFTPFATRFRYHKFS